MDIIYIIIPVSLFFLFLSIYFFFWAIKNNQFSNFHVEQNILFDDKEDRINIKKRKKHD